MKKPQILITRPAGQHHRFQNALQDLGLKTVHCPCLVIEPIENTAAQLALHKARGAVLFTSVNAVYNAHKLRSLPWPGIRSYAIGPATAEALRDRQQVLDTDPEPPYNSESFLEICLNKSAEHLLIIKGSGGRNLIEQQLNQRGWQVSTIDVYCRRSPNASEINAKLLFSKEIYDLISISSDEGLTNLMELARPWRKQLLPAQLIVNSERSASLAQQLEFTNPALVANPAGDQGQLSCVRQWLAMHSKG
ncbi:MAG: uroporphyrinogen-III synthase [Granulosicoccus sp.]|nr:uroporphyrinogen-III synthase [Granulosicoccus sp.]